MFWFCCSELYVPGRAGDEDGSGKRQRHHQEEPGPGKNPSVWVRTASLLPPEPLKFCPVLLQLIFYYGATDHWCPVSFFQDMRTDFPDGDVRLCDKGLRHAFVLDAGREVAQMVAGWIGGSLRSYSGERQPARQNSGGNTPPLNTEPLWPPLDLWPPIHLNYWVQLRVIKLHSSSNSNKNLYNIKLC